jgi:hypothetical protein
MTEQKKSWWKNILSSVIDKQDDSYKETAHKGSMLTQGNVEVYSDMPSNQKLRLFQNKFYQSKGLWENNWQLINEREAIYNGTHDVDQNINNLSTNIKKKLSNNVRNIVYELIESSVDNSIPQPTVRSKTQEGSYLAKMIENSIKNDLADSKINKLNDKNERTTMKHGFSAIEIVWNPDYKHHLYLGEVELKPRHPKQVIPQTGVYDIDNMDYIFVMSSVTKGYVLRKFGVDLQAEREQFPEVNYIPDDEGYTNSQYEKVTEITCWYKDEDGDVGKLSWVNNVVLEDLPKFYYRRMFNKDGESTYIEPTETLTEDVILKRIDPVTGKPVIIPAGTKVPYFTPKHFPLLIRVNVPSDFGFGGISDIDVIRDQQDVVKKLTNNIEEKILRGGSIIKKLTGHKVILTSELNQVIEGTQQELQALDAVSLQSNIEKELIFLDNNYRAAKDTLGITDAWQGKQDTTAKSGIAKQIQVQQSGGRLQSKLFNKFDFYKQMFEMMFWFKLAYYDELRPFVTTDAEGKDVYGDFNKYEFLVQDKAGEWYYNTDFLFTADAGAGIPKDKVWQMQTTLDLFTKGAFNPTPQSIILWQQLQSVQYPGANDVQTMLEKQLQQMQQNVPQQTKVSEAISFKDLPPEGKVQMAAHAGIQISPESVMQQEDNQFQGLTDQLSPEELEYLEQNQESVMQEMQSMGGK